jgi:CRISPR-associated endoribonuclease Cas6
VTNVLCTDDHATPWSGYRSYSELIEQASHTQHTITLHFLTPTSFRRGNVDFPMPDPRLVFRNYRTRFEEFAQIAFLSDFDAQVEFYTGVARLHRLETTTIRTKKVSLVGFTGSVTYFIDKKAPPDLVFQMNLLADFAFFCGTGRKTTVGMGVTVRIEN